MSTPPDGSAGPPAGPPPPPPPGWAQYAGVPFDRPQRHRRPGRAVLTGVVTALVITAAGALLGLLWRLVAPGVPVTQSPDGPLLRDPQPEQFIAADGWFSLLGLLFGVLAAVAVWRMMRRWRGLVGLITVAFGAIGAALLAWWLGRQIGLGDYEQWRVTAAVGQAYLRPPDLRAGSVELLWGVLPAVRGDLLVPAFGAVVTYTLLAGWAEDPDLDADPAYRSGHPGYPGSGHPTGAGQPPPGYPAGPDYPFGTGYPTGPVSWDSPDRPAPTAAPGPPVPDAADPPRG